MVGLPGQLFYSTQIPVCLWFLSRNKSGGASVPASRFRDRRGKTLFIDARKLGRMIDRVHRELTHEDIWKIADTYHGWRGDTGRDAALRRPDSAARCPYQDTPGFCKSATLEEIRAHGHVLTPGRYVGAAEAEDDAQPFEDKMKHLTAKLEKQFAESAKLENEIQENLKRLKHDR
jgi:type I restriction enzyme M protein